MRDRFRNRLVTKLKARGYHGRKADWRACLRRGLVYERLRLKGVHKRAIWEPGHYARKEEEAGRWRQYFWGGGGV